MITRRAFLAAAATGVAAVGANAWLEPRRLTTTRHVLGHGAAGGDPLRVVQLTDLHLRAIDGHVEATAEAVAGLRPDILVITGDAIDRQGSFSHLRTFLSLLPPVPHAFATRGNWEVFPDAETRRLRSTYESAGVSLLLNETAELAHGGRRVLVTGLDDLRGAPNIHLALRRHDAAPNHLLLAHSPAYRDQLHAMRQPDAPAVWPRWTERMRSFRFTAMLSGHTHGGQIAILGHAPVRPWGSGRYVSGWYRDTDLPLFVSRGIGTSIVPVRFGAPPEIAVFDWHLEA